MKPLIGVTCNYREKVAESHNNYSLAVARAGGIPLILPPIGDDALLGETLDRLGGVLIIGGADIPPARYGEQPHPKTDAVSAERDRFDFRLIVELKRRNLPTLAICYGIQALNVSYGGTLWQDVPSALPRAVKHHRDASKNEPRQWHAVRVVPGTRLHRILGVDRLDANSSHHQAIKAVAPGLVASAFCEADDVVEAVEDPWRRFMIGIQWHPEALTDLPLHLRIFEALVEEARR